MSTFHRNISESNNIKNYINEFGNTISDEEIMSIKSNETYNSDISIDTNIIPIYVFSDVHADIQALIISLRDCAGVIKKKSNMQLPNLNDNTNNEKYLPTVSDPYLENMLNIDIFLEDGEYDESLGYEWCGGSSIIVIIGDLIDGSRGFETLFKEKQINHHDTLIHDYPQLEIKLIRFINSINKMAMGIGGRIHKLLGNHEIMNFLSVEEYANQTFSRLIDNEKYYVNRKNGEKENRRQSFQCCGSGYNLIMEDGAGVLLKINNNIFVHASIQKVPFNIIKKINNIINDPTTDFTNLIPIYNRFSGSHMNSYFPKFKDVDKLLWDRTYGDSISNETGLTNITCKNVISDLKFFFKDNATYVLEEYINTTKIFVGHCIQAQYKDLYKENPKNKGIETFTTIDNTNPNPNVEELIGPAMNGPQNVQQNLLYGITMSCPINMEHDKHRVYKVDVGSSRSQDQGFLVNPQEIINIEDEKYNLLGRSPQVLKIFLDRISIIRSKMNNTRIYQPRPRYESHAQTMPRPEDDKNTINYLKKYLKYKNKYLVLKKKF